MLFWVPSVGENESQVSLMDAFGIPQRGSYVDITIGAGTVTSVSATSRGAPNPATITVTDPTTTPVIDLPRFATGANEEIAIGDAGPADFSDMPAAAIAIGGQAGGSLDPTRGVAGIFIGLSAGLNVQTSGGVNSIAIGTQSLTGGDTTGNNNTAIGSQSGLTIGAGSDNICIGNQSGSGANAIGVGSNNVLIGFGTNLPVAGSSGATVINDAISHTNSFVVGFASGFYSFNAPLPTDAKYGYQNNTGGADADTSAITRHESSGGPNGAASRMFVGTRNPSGVITGNPGDYYRRVDGVSSALYVNVGAAIGNTVWTMLGVGAPGSAPLGKELFPSALINQQNFPWTGAAGGFGDLYMASVVIESTTAAINEMRCIVTQAPGGAGGINLGIYDAAGVRLAYGNITSAVVGLNVIALVNGGGLTLTEGNQYFFALYSNQNGVRVAGQQGLVGVPAGVNLGFEATNTGSLPGVDQGFIPDVSAFFGNQSAERFYSIASN